MDAGSVTHERTVMRAAHPVQRVTSTSKVRRKRVAHEERRRRHRRSGRDERRLGRGARVLLFLGRRRGASCLRFGRARHHARSPWVARRKHPVQPKKGVARRRNHRRQTRETLYRRHHALHDATAPGVLHAVHHQAVATHALRVPVDEAGDDARDAPVVLIEGELERPEALPARHQRHLEEDARDRGHRARLEDGETIAEERVERSPARGCGRSLHQVARSCQSWTDEAAGSLRPGRSRARLERWNRFVSWAR